MNGKTHSLKFDNLILLKTNFSSPFPPQVETFIHNPKGHTPFDPLDMAIDPYSRLLFWTCDNQTAINVTRLDGTPVGLVISRKDQKPRLLALMPEKGYRIIMYGYALTLNALVGGGGGGLRAPPPPPRQILQHTQNRRAFSCAASFMLHLTLIRLGYFGSWKNWGGGGAYKAPP